MSTCPFCLPNWVNLEIVDSNTTGSIAAITPLNPVTPGHVVVIHSKHTDSAADDPEQAGYLMAFAAKYVARNDLEANIITSIGHAASQAIDHTTVHIIPRTEGDGIALPWTAQQDSKKRRAS
jgi:diadenosine tetraphosphate (Ap4A) HIT family hydrolase